MTLLINDQQKKAVAYYRHSAEDKQENSVHIQQQHTHKFAKLNKIQIIHEEADEGKSGLQASRPGFQHLFQNWILKPNAPPFSYILVYDVSRWGRFQDQDEAGYYEFLCRKAGKLIIYVNQGFPKKDDPLVGNLRTSLERYMAAEYSRQLSNKVFHGSVEVSQQGFSAGGPPPYGMSRLLLNKNKKPVRILKPGEHKQIANERVTFVPGKNNESDTIKRIFLWFVEKNLTPHEICIKLNSTNTPLLPNNWWNTEKIKRVLKNQKYIGTLVYNKTSNRLKQGRKNNPESEWIIVKNAFPTLIEKQIFYQAQNKLQILTQPQRQLPNAFTKAKQLVTNHLSQLMPDINHNNNTPVSQIPILYSATRITNTREWCFTIPPKLKQHQQILAVGVRNPQLTNKIKTDNWIEELFLLPDTAFNPMMFLLISENEHNFHRYRINEETFNKIVRKLTQSKPQHEKNTL